MPTSLGNNADAAATVWNAMKVAFEVHQAGASKDSPCSLTLDIARVDSSRIRDLIETQMWKLALHVERGHHAFEDGDTALSVFSRQNVDALCVLMLDRPMCFTQSYPDLQIPKPFTLWTALNQYINSLWWLMG